MATKPAVADDETHSGGNGHAVHPPAAAASADRELAREGLRALATRRELARLHGPVDLDRRTLFGPLPHRPSRTYLAALLLCPVVALALWSVPALNDLTRRIPWWEGPVIPFLFALVIVPIGLELPGRGEVALLGVCMASIFGGLAVPAWIATGGIVGAALVLLAAGVLTLLSGAVLPAAVVVATTATRPPHRSLAMLNTFARWVGFADALLPLRVGVLMKAGYGSEAVELIRARRRFVRPRLQEELDRRLGVALVMVERDLEEAEELLRAALEDSPHEEALHVALGMCLHLQDRHAEAASELEPMGRLIDRVPAAQRAAICFAVGDSLLHLGRSRDAAPWLKKSRAWIEQERARHGAAPAGEGAVGACCGGEGESCAPDEAGAGEAGAGGDATR